MVLGCLGKAWPHLFELLWCSFSGFSCSKSSFLFSSEFLHPLPSLIFRNVNWSAQIQSLSCFNFLLKHFYFCFSVEILNLIFIRVEPWQSPESELWGPLKLKITFLAAGLCVCVLSSYLHYSSTKSTLTSFLSDFSSSALE